MIIKFEGKSLLIKTFVKTWNKRKTINTGIKGSFMR